MQKKLNSKEAKLKTDSLKDFPNSLKNLSLKNITDQELKQITGGKTTANAQIAIDFFDLNG